MIKKFAFRTLVVLLLLITTAVLFEVSYHLIKKFDPSLLGHARIQGSVKLDYGDTARDGGLGPGGYLKEDFQAFVKDGYGNPVWWKNNKQGFRHDTDTTLMHDANLIRILSLGDSFSAGYRVGQEQTFSRLMERYFNQKKQGGNSYEVLISCIEEPASGLFYLQRHGMKFKPDVVMLGITLGNDIAQSYIALDQAGNYSLDDATGEIAERPNPTLGFTHGLEDKIIPPRCLSIHPRKPTMFERLAIYKLFKFVSPRYRGEAIVNWYGVRDVPRMFDACNGFGVYLAEPPPEIREAYARLFRILKGFQIMASKQGFSFIVMIFPQRFQIQPADWLASIDAYSLNEQCFELMKPNELIGNFCNNEGIACLDPTLDMQRAFNRSKRSLYWPGGDMHWNVQGNAAFYESAKERVLGLIRAVRK